MNSNKKMGNASTRLFKHHAKNAEYVFGSHYARPKILANEKCYFQMYILYFGEKCEFILYEDNKMMMKLKNKIYFAEKELLENSILYSFEGKFFIQVDENRLAISADDFYHN